MRILIRRERGERGVDENMSTKQRRPRLDRRNAIKHIDYVPDSSTTSSSSSSFQNQLSAPPLPPPQKVVRPLSDRTSFRLEGVDGEFDLICRSLGLSGPEDFAIPLAAWKACIARSPPSHRFSHSRFPNSHDSTTTLELKPSEEEDTLSDCFQAKFCITDEVKLGNECNQLNSAGIGITRVRVNGEVEHEDDKSTELHTVTISVSERLSKGNGCRINGVRPPVLAPPPVMSVSVVDNVSSTWDLFRAFGPQENENLASPRILGKEITVEESEENQGMIIRMKDEGEDGATGRDVPVSSESFSDTSNDDNDDDYVGPIEDPVYSISPNGKFRRSIKSWQKGDFLGSGSFGTVYEGFTDDGFFFAFKEVSLLDQGTQGKQRIYQLEQEISLLSQFEHENIVQYLGTDKDDGKLYIFLELVTKGSLANLYRKYKLRDSQVSAYTRQILSGLNYLHSRDVVHRDIKCANILVDVSGSVKLADFGLAKATKFNDVKSCKGTAFWMAPEVVNRKKNGYGLAADIWSLGCTVLEMLTRQIPYSHLEGMQALFRIGKGEPPPIPNSLSKDAQDFILKCLQVNPDDRPSAAQLLDHPFVKQSLSTFFPAFPLHYSLRP